MSPVPKDRSKESVRKWLLDNDRERRQERMTDEQYKRIMGQRMASERDNRLK